MTYTDRAEDIARSLLEQSLPRRWAHIKGVARAAGMLAPILGGNTDLLTAAALLHDIGYAPTLVDSGFHPLDGARYLRDVEHADPMLCRLVAHHSCAIIEAEEYGLAGRLTREFKPAPRGLADALIYCDITTGPDGQRLTVGQRLADIRERYSPSHPVSRALERSEPQLRAAADRVSRKLDPHTASARPVRVVAVGAF
jgi:putative nucleotidyltransferase with HDIG domain